MKVKVNGVEFDIEIRGQTAKINGELFQLQREQDDEILLGKRRYSLDFLQEEDDENLLMIVNGMAFLVSRGHGGERAATDSVKEVRAPMSGQLVDVSVGVGSEVKKGQLLFVLEAMKMENQIKSPTSGRVKFVQAVKGQQVKLGDLLITLE